MIPHVQRVRSWEKGIPKARRVTGGRPKKGRKNEINYQTHNAQPTFPEARFTSSWMLLSGRKRLALSLIGSDKNEALWDFVSQYACANWPRVASGATSRRWRRPKMHVSEAGQSVPCAGAMAWTAPEAQGDGAAVTRFCPRWRGRAAAGVAAAAA